jgi:hypothetical protein
MEPVFDLPAFASWVRVTMACPPNSGVVELKSQGWNSSTRLGFVNEPRSGEQTFVSGHGVRSDRPQGTQPPNQLNGYRSLAPVG